MATHSSILAWEIPLTGKFGLGIRNEAGQRLIEFCQENTGHNKHLLPKIQDTSAICHEAAIPELETRGADLNTVLSLKQGCHPIYKQICA